MENSAIHYHYAIEPPNKFVRTLTVIVDTNVVTVYIVNKIVSVTDVTSSLISL